MYPAGMIGQLKLVHTVEPQTPNSSFDNNETTRSSLHHRHTRRIPMNVSK
jgi:hypothetical protein